LRDTVKERERALSEEKQRMEQLLDYILLQRKRQFSISADRSNKDLFHEAELELPALQECASSTFVDGLPFYRQEAIYTRERGNLNRQDPELLGDDAEVRRNWYAARAL